MRCGLLGRKLSHSYSPQIHAHLGTYHYDLFEKEPGELESFLKQGDFSGLNVTIPYKKDVIPYCGELTDRARMLGAVNTIVRKPDGTLIGHNTDYFGFRFMLDRSRLQVQNKKVLVLGSGGASNTVSAVLKELGARVIIISRHGNNRYDNLDLHRDASAIVNATPVGMYPHNGASPLDLHLFPNLEGVLDLIYNPAYTGLLLDAQEMGLTVENGLAMLVAQAKESAEWFTGNSIDNSVILKILQQLRSQMKNVILIGMPGCGKSSVGKELAARLNRPFVDSDVEIVNTAGKSISEIFRDSGEPEFRSIETRILGELGKQSGLVIATGGGCVTQQQNYPLLHQNGSIFWLTRQTQKLPVNGRPISQKTNLEELYRMREPMYRQFADFTVCNDQSLDQTIDLICNDLSQEVPL